MQRSLERMRRRSRAHTRSVLVLRRPCREVQIGCSGFRLLRGCDRDRDQVRLEDGDMDRSCVWCCKRLLHSGRRLYTFFEVMLSSSFDEARPRQFLFLHWINSINSIATPPHTPHLPSHMAATSSRRIPHMEASSSSSSKSSSQDLRPSTNPQFHDGSADGSYYHGKHDDSMDMRVRINAVGVIPSSR